MKKLLVILLSLLVLVGCGSSNENDVVEPTPTPTPEVVVENVNILAPNGAPALSVVSFMDNNKVDYVAGADVIQANLLNADSEYDVIIAPTNLGLKLASKKGTSYKMAGVVTWGNLYVLGYDESKMNDENSTIALFGEGAVPGLIYNLVNDQIKAQPTYFASASETGAQLMSKKYDFALTAEPFTSTVMTKDENLKVVFDLQAAYKNKFGYDGYPQASIFIKESSYEANPELYDALLSEVKENLDNKDHVIELVKGLEDPSAIGFKNPNILDKNYDKLNLKFAYAKDVIDEVDLFMNNFKITDSKEHIID